jgi:hypothetical protein
MANSFPILRTRTMQAAHPVICHEREQHKESERHDWVPLEILVGFIVVLYFLCQL